MQQFPTAKHLASWAGLCPGQYEGAGRRKAGTTRKGNRWLRTALVEAALSAARASKSALASRYRRVMRHRGHKKAVIAVAHAMLISIYHVLAHRVPYHDLGADYYDRRHANRVRRRAIETLRVKAIASLSRRPPDGPIERATFSSSRGRGRRFPEQSFTSPAPELLVDGADHAKWIPLVHFTDSAAALTSTYLTGHR